MVLTQTKFGKNGMERKRCRNVWPISLSEDLCSLLLPVILNRGSAVPRGFSGKYMETPSLVKLLDRLVSRKILDILQIPKSSLCSNSHWFFM